ncbi:hypothetical protein LCGC14_1283360 [marine sediment metagenome]|uniref:Uncharacterized protein n=1 Tax=marine sediment metagenome TaxID=412755 RepID=A0A0F9KUK1_9ZZZZ
MSPSVNDLKDSKFLTKEDADPAIIVTIAGWDKVDVSLETQPSKMKYVLKFEETDKPLVLNNTNGMRIEHITGKSEFDEWIGEKITLFNDKTVEFGGKMVGGIRVYVKQAPLPTADQMNQAAEQDLGKTMPAEKPEQEPTDDIPF